MRFLVIAHASCEETIEHLDLLRDTRSMPSERYAPLAEQYDTLARKLSRFIEGVELHHRV